MQVIEQLKTLYAQVSKHSSYQILPGNLRKLLNQQDFPVRSRFETERLKYIFETLSIENKSILDIGGNSGFFSFEMLDAGASHVHYYEGNREHSNFVRLAAKLLNCEDKIEVTEDYFLFDESGIEKYDIALLLNVLHHVGDDYGDGNLGIEQAKEQMIKQLNTLASMSSYLVLQLGYCWKGDINYLLFDKGTKNEMIEFVSCGVEEHWEVRDIGIADDSSGKLQYSVPSPSNMARREDLGEFLNRPIFILKSRKDD